MRYLLTIKIYNESIVDVQNLVVPARDLISVSYLRLKIIREYASMLYWDETFKAWSPWRPTHFEIVKVQRLTWWIRLLMYFKIKSRMD